jgi:hypothetical protein
MSMSFQKATKRSARLRMALIGVAGSGKTYTALSIAQHLGKKIAVLDTERGSASKYSDVFEFDVMEPEVFSPKTYIDAIEAAEEAGYDVLIIDSLSHAWTGQGGALDQVDKAARRSQSGNTFGAWRDVTPQHNSMVDAIIGGRLHIIATMRAKTEYVQRKTKRPAKPACAKWAWRRCSATAWSMSSTSWPTWIRTTTSLSARRVALPLQAWWSTKPDAK